MPICHLIRMIAILAVVGWSGMSAFACNLTARWDDDPPFFVARDGQPPTGISVVTLGAIAEGLGCHVTFVRLPWARGLLMLQSGEIDLVSGAFRTAERDRYAWFSDPLLDSPNVLFIRRADQGRWPAETLPDLRRADFRLGVQIGVNYSPDYSHLMADPDFRRQTIAGPNHDSLWRMLAAGRVDGVIADEMTGLYEIRRLGLDAEMARHGLIVSREPAFVAFSRKTIDAAFVDRFNAELARLTANGQLQHRIQPFLVQVQ